METEAEQNPVEASRRVAGAADGSPVPRVVEASNEKRQRSRGVRPLDGSSDRCRWREESVAIPSERDA